MKRTPASILLALLISAPLRFAGADAEVKLGRIGQFDSAADLDFDGNIIYAVRFGLDVKPVKIKDANFLPGSEPIRGVQLVCNPRGNESAAKHTFGGTPDDRALEEVMGGFAASPKNFEVHLNVVTGRQYKLQMLMSANRREKRTWDIMIDDQEAVDEFRVLGERPDKESAQGRCAVYTYEFTAPDNRLDIVMGDLFGHDDGGNRKPLCHAFTLEDITIPPAPSALKLGKTSFFAAQTAPVAEIAATDGKFRAKHAYSLVPGEGDRDNSAFRIDGNLLRTDPASVSNKPGGAVFSVRIRAEDMEAADRYIEKAFSLKIVEPHSPAAITSDAGSVSATARPNDLIARLSTKDPDAIDVHTYSLVAGKGDADNNLLALDGNTLRLAAAVPAGRTQLCARVRSTDLAFLSVETELTLPLAGPFVRISEFLAINDNAMKDAGEERPDWIEIQNCGPQYVNLADWYLTDESKRLTKWMFPAINIAPDGYLLVFASGTKAADSTGGVLHANFKLDPDGSHLALVKPDGMSIATRFKKVPQYPNVSYGYDAAGAGPGYLPKPTPAASNGIALPHGACEVLFSRQRGFLTEPVSLTLTASLPDSTIWYTTDGSMPSATAGIPYSGPITVTPSSNGPARGTSVIRAAASNSLAASAPVVTHTYIFVNGTPGAETESVVKQSVLNKAITTNAVYGPLMASSLLALPSVSVVCPVRNLTGQEVEASIELIDPAGKERGFQVNCGIKAVGGSTEGMAKHHMRLFFRAIYGAPKLLYPVFPDNPYGKDRAAEKFDVLQLHSGSHDSYHWMATASHPRRTDRDINAQYTRNKWAHDMQFAMGDQSVHGRFVHVYWNGSYNGLYLLEERPTQHFMASYCGGKPEDYHYCNASKRGSDHGGGDTWKEPWRNLRESATNYAVASLWLDMNHFIDYTLLLHYAGNMDWGAAHNWMAAGPKESGRGGWKFFPWDSDLVLLSVETDTMQKSPANLLERLMNYDDFKVLFRDRVYRHCFNGGALTPGEAQRIYDASAQEIFLPIVAETARWQPGSSKGTMPWDRDEEWKNEWDYLRNTFFPGRTATLLKQLRRRNYYPVDAPEFNRRGGEIPRGFELAIANPNPTGTVYYTVNGTDPRLPGGAVNEAARIYTAPFPINEKLDIKARIVQGGEWSALNEALFTPSAR